MSFNFNQPGNTTSAFTLGTSTPATSGISFGIPTATAAPAIPQQSGGFPFAPATSQPTQSGLNFNFPGASAPAPTTTPTLGINTSATGFSLGATKPPATGLAFNTANTSAPSTTVPTSLPFGTGLPTSTTTGFAITSSAAATTTAVVAPISTTSTGFSLNLSTLPGSSISTTQLSGTTTTNTVVPTSGPAPPTTAQSVNFVQLEENINKWTIELEEQEKVFMNQVTHINEWDRLLIANGDKIVTLNNNVEKVKLEQQQLDHELDFIVAQQRELEECLLPLEKEFANITVSDPERDTTYRMAENLNTQLRSMSEDLKEVIEHINEKNKNQDTSDPIVQIGRILNAHMNSLQWIDQNTTTIKQQLDQLSKLTEMHRRENDSTQNL